MAAFVSNNSFGLHRVIRHIYKSCLDCGGEHHDGKYKRGSRMAIMLCALDVADARRNQEVTLTTVEPHQKLRIHSITSDYGLLRCKPLSTAPATASRGLTPLYSRGDFGGEDRSTMGGKKGGEEWVDLQPDGNSFDLMIGLIKRKI